MERGKLPPRGVSERVLDALGAILGRSADALRRAGEGLSGAGPRGPERRSDRVRAHGARPGPGGRRPARRRRAPPPDDAEPWDEVDELFRGRA